jgi:hypothetical protein
MLLIAAFSHTHEPIFVLRDTSVEIPGNAATFLEEHIGMQEIISFFN